MSVVDCFHTSSKEQCSAYASSLRYTPYKFIQNGNFFQKSRKENEAYILIVRLGNSISDHSPIFQKIPIENKRHNAQKKFQYKRDTKNFYKVDFILDHLNVD